MGSRKSLILLPCSILLVKQNRATFDPSWPSIPASRKEEGNDAYGSCTHLFYSQLIGWNSVIWPHLPTKRVGNLSTHRAEMCLTQVSNTYVTLFKTRATVILTITSIFIHTTSIYQATSHAAFLIKEQAHFTHFFSSLIKTATTGVPWWHGRLRIWHCHCSVPDGCCGFYPWPRNFHMLQAWPKRKKEKELPLT